MPTGFDYIGQDQALQQHWLKRFVAIVIDSVIVYIPILVLTSILGGHYVNAWLLSGIALFLYASLFDAAAGGTIGKMVVRLKAVPMTGGMSMSRALMRNVSKVFALILLLDWVIGMAVETRDPRQKWTDQVAHTSVMTYGRDGGL
jgi:uncharacterized RDD family membrane protein YckC